MAGEVCRWTLGLVSACLVGCSGGVQRSPGGDEAPTAEAETCYVIASDTDGAQLLRAESGEYSLTSSSWSRAALSFSSASQEVRVVQSLGGNGYQAFSIHLAPDGTVADAEFVDCPDAPTQFACFITKTVSAPIQTCAGTPVSVPSVAGCYDQGPDGYRVVIGGEPSNYHATASKAGGPAEAWDATEGPENVAPRQLVLSGGFDFSIGSTGRLWAYALDRNASSYTVFHACMNTALP